MVWDLYIPDTNRTEKNARFGTKKNANQRDLPQHTSCQVAQSRAWMEVDTLCLATASVNLQGLP